MKHEKIDHIVNSLLNGNFSQAKEQTQYLCRTLPEKQAHRVGQVVGSLCDPLDRDMPDLAVTYLRLFE